MRTGPTQLMVTSWLSMTPSSPRANLFLMPLQLSFPVHVCPLAHSSRAACSIPLLRFGWAWGEMPINFALLLLGCGNLGRYGQDSSVPGSSLQRIPCDS